MLALLICNNTMHLASLTHSSRTATSFHSDWKMLANTFSQFELFFSPASLAFAFWQIQAWHLCGRRVWQVLLVVCRFLSLLPAKPLDPQTIPLCSRHLYFSAATRVQSITEKLAWTPMISDFASSIQPRQVSCHHFAEKLPTTETFCGAKTAESKHPEHNLGEVS